MSSAGCDIAVVIPVFKQPGFLVEAMESVLQQRSSLNIRTVIVDDGCPFQETRTIAQAYSRASEGNIAYLRRQNGGLSAARNSGIEFARRAWPEFRYLYFLDADNRIAPSMLDRMWRRMERESPEIGWLYPDIDMFGYKQNYSVSGDYSALSHILENYCEAGSFVARRVLDAGVRFDEDMKHGFEDWDFWLQAVERGFRGAHMPDSGFHYRRRAESMLVNSERMRGMIIGGMRVKHAALLKPQSLIRLEEAEAPRFAHFTGDSGVDLFVDPRRAKPLDGGRHAAERLFARSCKSPQAVFFPGKALFSAPGALEQLAKAKIDRAVLWLAEIMLRKRHFVFVSWRFDDSDRISVEPCETAATLDEVRAARLIVGRTVTLKECAADPNPDWIRTVLSPSPRPLLAAIRCVLPKSLALAEHAVEEGQVVEAMLETIARLGARLRGFTSLKPEWRMDARLTKSRVSEVYAFNAACGVVLPHVTHDVGSQARKQIGFILPLLEFGGVEKVVMNYARVFRDRGCDVHLFLTKVNEAGLARQAAGLFSSIHFLATPAADEGDWDHLYYGAGASKFARSGDTRDALGLLSTMDVVVNTHSPSAHGVMAGLRKQGTKTYVGLHLVELSRHGHPMGNPNVALAYEHAYDGFIVISRKLESWCAARAIPASKIVFTPNAASYPCDASRLEKALARRETRDAAAALRVLYLGRLDAQKGLDRLPEIMLGAPAPAFEWRLVGGAILADDDAKALVSQISRIGAPIEPPALTNRELDALYAWADVFVLPSRFEGVPLTILEAQRFGCIPIATDVGAVSEIIEHGVDGFLIDSRRSETEIVSDFVATLVRLAASPETVAAVARLGAERQKQRAWEANMQNWLEQALPDANGSPHA